MCIAGEHSITCTTQRQQMGLFEEQQLIACFLLAGIVMRMKKLFPTIWVSRYSDRMGGFHFCRGDFDRLLRPTASYAKTAITKAELQQLKKEKVCFVAHEQSNILSAFPYQILMIPAFCVPGQTLSPRYSCASSLRAQRDAQCAGLAPGNLNIPCRLPNTTVQREERPLPTD